MHIYAINNTGLHKINGIPDGVAETLCANVQGVQRVLRFYLLGVYLHEAYEQLQEWSEQQQGIHGNRAENLRHKAERLCRGFLFEFRTCLDHIETEIKRQYGEDSEFWRFYKRHKNEAYDNHPEYAFTYKLRNCSQHCTEIVHGFNGSEGLGLSSNRELLLTGYDGWKPCHKEHMENLGKNIELLPQFRQALAAFDTVLTALIQYLLDENGTDEKLAYIKKWGDALHRECGYDINDINVIEFVYEDGRAATAEEFEAGTPGIAIHAQVIDWDTITDLFSRLQPRTAAS